MDRQEVVVVDVKIPIRSLVILMLKGVVAAIPAAILAWVVLYLLFVLPNFIPRP